MCKKSSFLMAADPSARQIYQLFLQIAPLMRYLFAVFIFSVLPAHEKVPFSRVKSL